MTDEKIIKPFDFQEFKQKMGLESCVSTPEDYSSIVDDDWYYVKGDGGMLGKDVKAKKIALFRVKTWKEYKEDQERIKQYIEDERRKRKEAEEQFF